MMVKVLLFIKKYPMSILLAVIAIQLFNISGNLAPSGKLAADKLACLEWTSQNRNSPKILTDEEVERLKKRAATKVGTKAGYIGYYCSRLLD